MSTTTTMTIRLEPELKAKLDSLASLTRRSKSFLAAEAVAGYVEREMAIVEGVEKGLADMRAGRLVPHDQAMEEIYQTIRYPSRTSSYCITGQTSFPMKKRCAYQTLTWTCRKNLCNYSVTPTILLKPMK